MLCALGLLFGLLLDAVRVRQTYRHATLSGRRNQRHMETSLVMPTTEVTLCTHMCLPAVTSRDV